MVLTGATGMSASTKGGDDLLDVVGQAPGLDRLARRIPEPHAAGERAGIGDGVGVAGGNLHQAGAHHAPRGRDHDMAVLCLVRRPFAFALLAGCEVVRGRDLDHGQARSIRQISTTCPSPVRSRSACATFCFRGDARHKAEGARSARKDHRDRARIRRGARVQRLLSRKSVPADKGWRGSGVRSSPSDPRTRHGGEDATALALAAFIVGIFECDYEAAFNAFDKAFALNPSSALAFGISSLIRAWSGDSATAVEHAERALRLSPSIR